MLGVGVIGFGYWGPNLARCFAETEGCSLEAIADPSSAALARAGKRYPAARCVSDWREVLNDPKIDAVAIATPVRTHHEVALAALRAGKHVLVEKPMTETSDEAKSLIDEAIRRDLTLMVGHTFIYASAVQKMHELITSGDLGQIYYYDSMRVNLGLFRKDVDVIWDLAIHDLSILQYILGKTPNAVSANGVSHVKGSPENMAQVTLYFDEGMIANLNVNWLAPVKVRQVLIGGSRKMIVYNDVEPSEKIKVYDRGLNLTDDPEEIYRMRVSYRLGDMWAPQLSTTEPMLAETAHFIESIQNSTAPLTDGRLGLGVVKVLEAASQSMHQRGQPVELTSLRMVS